MKTINLIRLMKLNGTKLLLGLTGIALALGCSPNDGSSGGSSVVATEPSGTTQPSSPDSPGNGAESVEAFQLPLNSGYTAWDAKVFEGTPTNTSMNNLRGNILEAMQTVKLGANTANRAEVDRRHKEILDDPPAVKLITEYALLNAAGLYKMDMAMEYGEVPQFPGFRDGKDIGKDYRGAINGSINEKASSISQDAVTDLINRWDIKGEMLQYFGDEIRLWSHVSRYLSGVAAVLDAGGELPAAESAGREPSAFVTRLGDEKEKAVSAIATKLYHETASERLNPRTEYFEEKIISFEDIAIRLSSELSLKDPSISKLERQTTDQILKDAELRYQRFLDTR